MISRVTNFYVDQLIIKDFLLPSKDKLQFLLIFFLPLPLIITHTNLYEGSMKETRTKLQPNTKPFKEAQDRLTIDNIYNFLYGEVSKARLLNGGKLTNEEIRDAASAMVDTFIEDFYQTHPNEIVLSKKDREKLIKDVEKTIRKLDNMLAKELASVPKETLEDLTPKLVGEIQESIKLKVFKKTEETQKPKSGLRSLFSRAETSIVDDLNKAILDMTSKATAQKGKNEGKSNVETATPPTPKKQTKEKQPTKPAENYLTRSERRDIDRTRAERGERMAKHVERLQQETPPVAQKTTEPQKAVKALPEKSKTSHTKKSKLKTFVSSLLGRNKQSSGRER